jgi:8-oxo-dGTP pyrophosphatase MutT (NUDIX family)
MKDKSIGIIPVRKINDEYSFLLIHEIIGHWGFPKGHPNMGEAELMTAMREFYEETEINICDICDDFKYTQQYSFKEKDMLIEKEVIFFLGLIDGNKEISFNNEISESRWFSFDEALDQLTYEDNKLMIKNAINFLEKKAPLNFKRYQFDNKVLLK